MRGGLLTFGAAAATLLVGLRVGVRSRPVSKTTMASLLGHSLDAPLPPAVADEAGLQAAELAAALLSFGSELQAHQGPTAFLSPLSVLSALSLAAAGATPDSPAAKALAAVLRGAGGGDALVALSSPTPAEAAGNVALVSANAVFVRSTILPSYVAAVKAGFGAVAAPLTTAAAVNGWVSQATQGKIGHLVDEALVQDPLTQALLLNAVYFKAAWEHPFDANLTSDGEFRTLDASTTPCRYMTQQPLFLPFAQTAAGTAVALPYVGGRLRALLILPAEPGAEGLARLSADGSAMLCELRGQLVSRKVDVRLPRLRLETGVVTLKPALHAMGLGPAMSGAAPGSFARMSDDKGTHISDVLHTTLLELSEEGTVAAAATAVVMRMRSMAMPSPVERVIFDRPFLLVIEAAESGAPLFMGAVVAPKFAF